MDNPNLLTSFASTGTKETVPAILQDKGWSPTNPNVHGYQLNELFFQLFGFANHIKKKGLSFYDGANEDYVAFDEAEGTEADMVRDGNKIYFCIQDNGKTSPKAPATNPDYWEVFLDLSKPIYTELAKYALKNGSNQNLFKVKDGEADDEAVSKKQMETALENLNVNTATGFKNFIINGGFDVWDKGLSFPTTNQYTANRCHSLLGNVQGVPSELNRTYDYQITLSNGGSTNGIYAHAILRENIQHLQNKKVAFSMKRKGAIGNFQVYFIWRDTLLSSTNQTNVKALTFTKSTTEWETFEASFLLPEANPTNKHLLVVITAGADFNSTCKLNEIQLEEGEKATNFENRPLWLEKELCSYFYEKKSLNMLVGQTNDSTGVRGLLEYKNKRIEPSVVTTRLGTFNDNNVTYSITSVSFSSVKKDKCRYDATVSSNGFLNKYPVYGDFDVTIDAEVY